MTTALKWSAIGVLVVLGASALVVGALRWIDPPTTAFMLRQSGPVIQEWVPMEAISPTLVHAAVTSEDQRFYQHWGLDIAAIQTALEEGDRGGAVRGASTITQQVAKNLFLTPARNYFRKVAEAYLAVLVDLLWSKRRIMEVYLNIAQFGDNLFGVEAASRHYFGKSAAALSTAEAALLVAALPSPRRSNPARPSDYLRDRQRWILSQMER